MSGAEYVSTLSQVFAVCGIVALVLGAVWVLGALLFKWWHG